MIDILGILNNQADPVRTDHKTHAQDVRVYNQLVHDRVGKLIRSEHFPEIIRNNLGIYGAAEDTKLDFALIGSDAREEKGVYSPVDIVAHIQNSQFSEPSSREFSRLMLSHPLSIDRTFGCTTSYPAKKCFLTEEEIIEHGAIDDKVDKHPALASMEIRDLDIATAEFGGDLTQLRPSRVTDCVDLNLYGDNLLRVARQNLQTALKNPNSDLAKRCLARIRRRATESRRISRTGENRFRGINVRHFDLDEGVAFFLPASQLNQDAAAFQASSVKPGMLRAIQEGLTRVVIQNVVSGDVPTDYLIRVPPNTQDKVEFLRETGSLKAFEEADIVDLMDNYHFFLWIYHRSEYNYSNGGFRHTEFPVSEVKERVKDLLALETKLHSS